MEITAVRIEKPEDVNFILGHSHFIKTVEDLFEVLAESARDLKFGLAFCESSGPALVRFDGTDDEMTKLAVDNAKAIGAGHSFIVFLKDAFPVNVLPAVRGVSEVCRIFCATANPTDVLVVETDLGRAIVGVVDGGSPKGVEGDADKKARRELLRVFGYKR